VRQRSDPRVCRDAIHRASLESVHLDLRVQDALRTRAGPPSPGGHPLNLAMHIFHKTNFDFLRWRWHAIGLSWVVIIAGILVLWTRGIPLGLEFAGGTEVILQFDQT